MDRDTTLTSPVNGTATAVEVESGASVSAGQVLLRLESMKMEFVVEAPHAGRVVELRVRVGDVVDAGDGERLSVTLGPCLTSVAGCSAGGRSRR